MKVRRVKRHIFVTREYDDICYKSKNLYNYCNYILRQCITDNPELIEEYLNIVNDEGFIPEYALTTRLAKDNQRDYRSLPSQTAQQVIKLLYKNWKAFFRAIKDWSKNKSKYRGMPKPPRYKKKDGRNIVIFTNQQAKIRNGYLYFPKMTKLRPIKTNVLAYQFKQVRIVPRPTCYIVEIVYERTATPRVDLDENLYLGIDLGIDNFVTMVDNQGHRPFIIKGGVVKSWNQYFNKKKAKLMSYIGSRGTSNKIKRLTLRRNCKIENYMHHASKFVVDYCVTHRIKTIVVGYNKQWKQKSNMGDANNQNFVSIPHYRFIEMLKYKAEEVDISVILQEESYTSKCDALALEPLEKRDAYLGKRIHRGLFQSSIGKLINADVNGALNILRKAIGDSFVRRIVDRGLVFNPVKVDVL